MSYQRMTKTFRRCSLLVIGAIILVAATLNWGEELSAQEAPLHYRQSADLAPGRIGRDALARGPAYRGYFQPVEVAGPKGSKISLLNEGKFVPSESEKPLAGMLIGEVYRFKVSEIPGHSGFELYPTIEVVNRLFPPRGLETKFPIPVHVSAEEVQQALDGKFITRVIYLEDPELALPARQTGGSPRILEVGPTEDPLKAADALGRPMAILRIGSRVPVLDDPSGLEFGFPPLQLLDNSR